MTKPAKPAPDLRMIALDIRMMRDGAERVLKDVASLLGLEIKWLTLHWLSSFVCELANGGVRLYQIRITQKGFWLLEHEEIVKNATSGDGPKNKGRFFKSVSELEKYLASVYQSQISAFIGE